MNMKACAAGAWALSVTLLPGCSDPCLTRPVGCLPELGVTLGRDVSTLWILGGRAGHQAHHYGALS